VDPTSKPDLSALRIRRDEPPPRAPGPPGSRRWRLWMLVVAAAVLMGTGALLARGRGRSFTVQTGVVGRLSPAAARSMLTATGYVVAQRQAAVASKGTGRLQLLNVEEGDHVRAGDVIGRLESADVEASLAAARAAVEQAASEVERARAAAKEAHLAFERARGLAADSLVAQSEFDAAEAREATARAGVQTAEAALRSAGANADLAAVQVENTYIRAPFDGTVLTKNADVGEVVAPFASSASSRGAVVTLADMSSLEVEADVSESNIRQVRAGQPCLVTLDALPAEPYRGRVKKIVPTADRAKATVLTKIEFVAPDERVLPEMSAKVSFLPAETDAAAVETRTVLTVPASALVERDGSQVAFVVHGERVQRAPVEAGERYGGAVEVRGGLQDGDIVVLDPPEKLRDGSRIRLKS
jgi:RND family efflux transporter MFP subunit